MINTNNYFTEIRQIDLSNFPEPLKRGHEFIEKATSNGESWNSYHSSETIKKTIDIYLSKLNDFVKEESKAKTKSRKEKPHSESIQPASKKKEEKHKEVIQSSSTFVERIPEEIRFIKRYLNLNGKTKTKEDILRFINALQKAILEKRIRKTSPYAKQIVYIQDKLLEVFDSMKNKIALEINARTLNQLKELVGGEKVYPSIQYLKKYVNMNGKPGTKEKAKKLLEQLRKAVDKKKITKDDTYATILNKAYENLIAFVSYK
jgi:hypothetical protein